MTGNTFTGTCIFLKTGVLDANFKKFRNFALFKESLKGRNYKTDERNLLKLRYNL